MQSVVAEVDFFLRAVTGWPDGSRQGEASFCDQSGRGFSLCELVSLRKPKKRKEIK